ncbi:hypothetical protein NLG97_g3841 [Lecanicillium saksenae]|uniref:Uncharacterized protein n=1 Tax=Lecanicillium saksenae TaxID=468837 RepID=A0ACC1R071_9HYPO|nr:hypothetical protein NLG97_g3841 [Lecanicillium saksenae]
MKLAWVPSLFALGIATVQAQVQAPALDGVAPPISPADRIYTGDQSSNTITVIQPSTGLYLQSVNAHGLGFSRDGKYLVSLSVTTNTATVIRCADNVIVSKTYTDRNAHEAFFAADNRTVWVGTRGVDNITVIDGIKGGVIDRISSQDGLRKPHQWHLRLDH